MNRSGKAEGETRGKVKRDDARAKQPRSNPISNPPLLRLRHHCDHVLELVRRHRSFFLRISEGSQYRTHVSTRHCVADFLEEKLVLWRPWSRGKPCVNSFLILPRPPRNQRQETALLYKMEVMQRCLLELISRCVHDQYAEANSGNIHVNTVDTW